MSAMSSRLPFQRSSGFDPLEALPDFDPGELGRDALRVISGRRRARRWTGWAMPGAIVVAVALGVVAAGWLMARRWQTPVPDALQPAVQNPAEFDRDAVIRAATEGMDAHDLHATSVPARDAVVA